ncbi:pantoate kinase [Halobacterium wangiae]|uniref:pantoate kinase n=1 Tax=Halobacterium wangiae TaxID=2902623 RepID=UPI001E58E766|nr:pantoate kinase [Halobacterium wangiae]
MSDDGAAAFVPGHVTGFFSVHRAADPRRAGSRGAGVTLSDGVTTRVEPADETTVRLNGRALEMESVTRVLDALDASATVAAETDLPLGAGFGVSGAMALGTALAANHAFGRGRSENDLVGVAHAAEVAAGTGLGDVVAQARGGIPIRVEPGAPEFGALDGVPTTGRVEYVSFGELSTSDVIGDETDVLDEAGERALVALHERPTIPEFFAASRRFAREADLLDGEVAAAVDAVTDAGAEATMAMLGRTVFALDTGLTDAGYDAESCRIHPAGARLER